jgi:hypothetical protein
MNKVKWLLKLLYVFRIMAMVSFGEFIRAVVETWTLFPKSGEKNEYIIFFRLLDPESELEIISYRVSQILFCARGPSNSPLSNCWAFTTSRPSTGINPQNSLEKLQHEVLYQCQVFRCENQDAVSHFHFILHTKRFSLNIDLSNFSQFWKCISSNSNSNNKFSSSNFILRSNISGNRCSNATTNIIE